MHGNYRKKKLWANIASMALVLKCNFDNAINISFCLLDRMFMCLHVPNVNRFVKLKHNYLQIIPFKKKKKYFFYTF